MFTSYSVASINFILKKSLKIVNEESLGFVILLIEKVEPLQKMMKRRMRNRIIISTYHEKKKWMGGGNDL